MCSDDASNKPSNNMLLRGVDVNLQFICPDSLLRREKREYLKQILDAVQEELDRCKKELEESE
jgi:hypothetical protein